MTMFFGARSPESLPYFGPLKKVPGDLLAQGRHRMTHLAILCVRNEAAFLLEWLAHHRAVGFDHFLVFSNDC